MLTALLAALGITTIGSCIALVAKFASDHGAAKAIANGVQNLPPVNVHTSHATFNEACNAAGNDVETAMKAVVTEGKADAFLAFMATNPTPAAILAWFETNAGLPFLAALAAQLPTLLQQGLTILGHSLPSVLGGLVVKAAPAVATQVAATKQAQLTAAQVAAGLASLSAPKAA